MLDPTRLGLLATSLKVDRKKSDDIVEKAADTVFGSHTGSDVTKIISDQYKGDVKTFQIKNSIEKLGVNFPRCPSCPDEAVCSSKCQECNDRESHLLKLVSSKEETNKALQVKISQVLDEYSPTQAMHLKGLSEKIREQGDLISSLSSQLQELGTCRDRITEKDKTISRRETLLLERNETIANLERVILRRDSDIADGKKLIQETNDALEELRSNNSSHVSSIVQEHLQDLAKRDLLMKELSKEKQSLEYRSRDLDSRLSSLDSSNSSVLEEKRVLGERVSALVKSMEETSSQVLELDSVIVSLTRDLEERDAKIEALNSELESIRDQMIGATKNIETCKNSMEENRKLHDKLEQDNEALKRSREEESVRVEKIKGTLNDVIASKDREISMGIDALTKSKEYTESLKRGRTKEGEKELSVKIEELRERDSRIQALVLEQRGLETQIREAEERSSSIDEERKTLVAEKKSLEEKNVELLSSMDSQSTQFERMKEEIMSLKQNRSSRENTISTMQTVIDTALAERQAVDADVEQMREDKSTLLKLFEACDEKNKESVSHSRKVEAEMTTVRERNEIQALRIKNIEQELGVCLSSARSDDKELEKKVADKKREIENLMKDTNDKIKSHEARLSFKSNQYSDLVGEKSALEKRYSDLKKSIAENEEGTRKASSRILELEREREALSEENREKILDLTNKIEDEKAKHKDSMDFLGDKIYQSTLDNTKLRTKLSTTESSLTKEKERGEMCTQDLSESEEVISRLEGVIEVMRMKASKDETFNNATNYMKEAPGSRNPDSRFLNEKYANLFWVPGTGKSKFARMVLEPGGNGKVEPKDVFAFWNQAFKNFDTKGPRQIMTSSPESSPESGNPVPVSLSTNEAFKTWVRVRKVNSCLFEPTGTSNITKIRSKEFLLWLYIIHLDGLVGDDGEELIPPGANTDQDGSFSLSSFNFSDMFKW